MIVTHSATLLADLQRLDHMLAIARNVLTAGEAVQNNAAQSGFDREVCSLINLCIKITARGFDGDASAKDEDKWQGVINGCKVRSNKDVSLTDFVQSKSFSSPVSSFSAT